MTEDEPGSGDGPTDGRTARAPAGAGGPDADGKHRGRGDAAAAAAAATGRDGRLLPDGGRPGPDRRTLLTLVGAGLTGAALARGDDVLDAANAVTGAFGGRTPPEGETGHADGAALALVPPKRATHRAVRSGAWDDPGTWDGGVPDDGARVHVPGDAAVTVRSRDPARLDWVRVDGLLEFDPRVDTGLRVEDLVTTPGSVLRIGHEDTPVGPETTAEVTFLDSGPLDRDRDPELVGRGLVAMGSVDVHGAETTTWAELAAHPERGDRTLELPEPPTNWSRGDRLVVPGMAPPTDTGDDAPDDAWNEDEAVGVERVEGTTVHLDRALTNNHVPPADDLPSYVVKLNRPVRFRSESTETTRRGHVMLMAPATTVRYAEFRDCGRTDKSFAFTNPMHGDPPEDPPHPNPRARYAFHYHRTGIEAEPHEATGLSVRGSPGWGVVNHHAHAVVTESVTHDVFGAGFVSEAGNERGAFRRNFALRSEGSGDFLDSRAFKEDGKPGKVDDFGHGGHGFWLQGPAVAVEGNVAAGHRYHAFVFWNRPLIDRELGPGEGIDDRRGTVANFPVAHVEGQPELLESDHVDEGQVSSAYVSLRSVTDNVAFASAGGLDVSRHQFGFAHTRTRAWSVVDGFTAFDIGTFTTHWGKTVDPDRGNARGANAGVTVRYSNNLRLRNLRLVSGRGPDGVGFNRNTPYPFHVAIEDSDVEGFDDGVRAMVRGVTRVTGTRLANRRNLVVADEHGHPTRRVQVRDCTFERGAGGNCVLALDELENLDPGGLFGDGGPIKLDDRVAFFAEQAPGHVPVPDRKALETLGGKSELAEWTGGSADDVVGLTNRQLADRYDLAVKGRVAPSWAGSDDRVTGLLESGTHASEHEAWLEAEDGGIERPWEVEEDASASGGAYITTSGVDSKDEPPSEGHATYRFRVASGEYHVRGRVQAPDGNADSFWVRVDGGEWHRWDGMRTRGGWEWESVPGEEGPRTFALPGGEHTLTVAFREDDTKLDRLVVTDDTTEPMLAGERARQS
ncbi:G8 domain-containing protein [Haloglomus litoreum]|uniref:G8 domain-containing protein n=1 Tax=Haloglomus litoreum TaxID=3034026 RepID=UPI0023E8034F|nr:G8 domain-containing protein [Haloglomus sp. DT116]